MSHSVLSTSLWPHGLYCPWNSPGQNTGVSELPISRGSSQLRDQTQVFHMQAFFLVLFCFAFFISTVTVESLFLVNHINAGICNATGVNISKFSLSQFKLFSAIMNLNKLYQIWKSLNFLKLLWWKTFELPRLLKVVRNDPKETKTWIVLQFLNLSWNGIFYESVPHFLIIVYMFVDLKETFQN